MWHCTFGCGPIVILRPSHTQQRGDFGSFGHSWSQVLGIYHDPAKCACRCRCAVAHIDAVTHLKALRWAVSVGWWLVCDCALHSSRDSFGSSQQYLGALQADLTDHCVTWDLLIREHRLDCLFPLAHELQPTHPNAAHELVPTGSCSL